MKKRTTYVNITVTLPNAGDVLVACIIGGYLYRKMKKRIKVQSETENKEEETECK